MLTVWCGPQTQQCDVPRLNLQAKSQYSSFDNPPARKVRKAHRMVVTLTLTHNKAKQSTCRTVQYALLRVSAPVAYGTRRDLYCKPLSS